MDKPGLKNFYESFDDEFLDDYLSNIDIPLSPKDLMIGDWVMYDPNIYLNRGVDNREKELPFNIKNGGDIDDAVHGCYSKIRLTPDILLKMGFKARNNGISSEPHYIYKDGNDEVSVKLGKSWTDIEYLNMIYNPEDPAEVNYGHRFELPYEISVHEFQHILKMCNIEIEFKL